MPLAIEMANAGRCLCCALPNAGRGWAVKTGDEHELLGLNFPRRIWQPRQYASHIAATSCESASGAARTTSGYSAGAAPGYSARAASGVTSGAAPGYSAGAASSITSGDATGSPAAAATRTAAGFRPTRGLLARHLAGARCDADRGLGNRRPGATLRR